MPQWYPDSTARPAFVSTFWLSHLRKKANRKAMGDYFKAALLTYLVQLGKRRPGLLGDGNVGILLTEALLPPLILIAVIR
jgi:hypothetical protein